MEPEPTWEELLGSNNWEGLLEPLNLTLRRLILRCGDFCQATYDAFNNDANSKFAGTSRYGKNSFFQKVMLQSADDYTVAAFLYATAQVGVPEALFLHSLSRESWDRESNWIGYIGVTSDAVSETLGRREIYVAFRGTTRDYEWINVLGAKPEAAEPLLRPKSLRKGSRISNGNNSGSSSDSDDDEVPKVMKGWLKIYVSNDPNSEFTKLSAREQLQTKIEDLRSQYKDENLSITLTGHSLGASLSILAAFDLCENGVNIPVTAIVFGSPQVGNKVFNQAMAQFPNLKMLHVRNKIDLIPHYPSSLLGYAKSGTELAMLHVVAGWNGEDGEFEMKVKRSLALVNKSSGFLKDECLVPESWWVEKNKGMVVDDNGDWVLASPGDEDLPVPEY
nr:phospholipase A1-IIdelta-like [Ipomoea batatas]GMD91533.1 phospholipase A1-IIdelta-like [Ipomoea batatas]